ncbi:MAG: FkbM family methyltransferase [Acetatifactor sp.]|nr:FkbM family methyltransferase [Acetatifactor sp.]
MRKFGVVAFDINGHAKEWLDANADEEHMELYEIITTSPDSPVQIYDLPGFDNWDVLLVFETGMRKFTEELLDKVGIKMADVLYPEDVEGSLLNNRFLAGYLFKGAVRDSLDYLEYRYKGSKYALASNDEFSYINVSTDNMILPYMYLRRDNWAADDMRVFFDLANEYFKFDEKQDIFCDIGANIGTTFIYFKKNLDRDIKALAFEPSKENYKMLRVNALLNDISEGDVSAVCMGLSDKSSKAVLKFEPTNPGSSYLTEGESENSDTVELISFDDYMEKNNIPPERLKYFWVDVEGFEARFLKGAKKTLKQVNVPFFMEFRPAFYEGKEGEFDLLMEYISDIFVSFICVQHREWGELPVERLKAEEHNRDVAWDIFLLKKDKKA